MKQSSNFTVAVLGVTLISTLALSPLFSQAEGLREARTQSPASTSRDSNNNFCAKLAVLEASYLKRFDDHQSNLEDKVGTTSERVKQNREKSKERQDLVEKKIDNNLVAFGQKFMEAASTTVQKEAVTKFQTTIRQAQEARRLAVDTAQKAFQAGVDASVATRKNGFELARTTFETTVKAAIEKARTDCANNVEVTGIRSAVQKAIKVARTKLTADIKAVDKVGASVKTLTETKNKAIKKAQADYKLIKDKALADFKALWSKTKKSETTATSTVVD